ncbi:hypothetical protein TrispH2_001276 [Trichoplax sp. H2]|nr:hypothetical protein TrispH2_001276 [Trichoplax sp. H2]|eukprot:RDD46386.1 hypothetical protein TrispH2_001276 [Trichoplax sp. H2]
MPVMAAGRFSIRLWRNYQTRQSRVPLIKFPDRRRLIADEGKTTVKISNGNKPSAAISPSVTPSSSRTLASTISVDATYSRKLLTEEEIDAIEELSKQCNKLVITMTVTNFVVNLQSGGSSTVY